MSNNILKELEELVLESAKKRTSFLLAVTKSSKSICVGATNWFNSEVELLKKEMRILESVMPDETRIWNSRLIGTSKRFERATSFLNTIIEQAEQGKITSIVEVHPTKPKTRFPFPEPIVLSEEKEEDKKLNLVSAILEVFDSASDLEKLITEVEKESKRTISTAKLVIEVLKKK